MWFYICREQMEAMFLYNEELNKEDLYRIFYGVSIFGEIFYASVNINQHVLNTTLNTSWCPLQVEVHERKGVVHQLFSLYSLIDVV